MKTKMKTFQISIIFFLLSSIAFGQTSVNHNTGRSNRTPPAGIIKVQSQVLGEPVPGAEIYLEQEPDEEPILSGFTGSEGNFEFTNLTPGNYSISIAANSPAMQHRASYNGYRSSRSNSAHAGISFNTNNTNETEENTTFQVKTPNGLYQLQIVNNSGINLSPITESELTNSHSIQRFKLLKFTVTQITSVKLTGNLLKSKNSEINLPSEISITELDKNISKLPQSETQAKIPIGIESKAIDPGNTGGSVTSTVAFSDYIIDNYNPNTGVPDAIIQGEQGISKNGDKLESSMGYFSISQGEPVPGAEIYLEQEPVEEPIASLGTTGKKGTLEFHEQQQLLSKVNGKDVSYKMQINIPGDYYKAKLKESNVGVVVFDYTINTTKDNIVYKILAGGEDEDNPNIKVYVIHQGASSGPYSVSQSNLEDNGIIDIGISLDNILGAQISNGILNCSSFTMNADRGPQTGKEIQIPAKKVVR